MLRGQRTAYDTVFCLVDGCGCELAGIDRRKHAFEKHNIVIKKASTTLLRYYFTKNRYALEFKAV